MLNLNSVSKAEADILRSLDKSDNKNKSADGKIVLNGLSHDDKNILLKTLTKISESTELSIEDKTAINFTLKALNGKEGGSSFIALKDNEPNKFNFPSPKTKEEKAVSSSVAKEPEVKVNIKPLSQEDMDQITKQKSLQSDFKKGTFVYSQNFGLLDKPHIRHNALTFITVYNSALKAVETGKPQELTLQYGKKDFKYTINPQKGDDLLKLARELTADLSYRYEDSTSYLGGLVNSAAEIFGRGGSAFSTEDLASNALGIHAAEEYIKTLTSTPDAPSQDAIDKLKEIGKPPSTNEKGEKFADWSEDWVVAHAGTLYKESESGLKRESYGNSKQFYPVHSKESGIKTPEKNELDFYRKINGESIDRGGHMSGKGKNWSYD